MSGINQHRFKVFVTDSGAEILPNTNPYEVLRFRCREGLGIVYVNKRGGITFRGAALTAAQFFQRKARWIAGKAYEPWEKPECVERLLKRDGPFCFYCGDAFLRDMTVEHLLSRAHGGTNADENLCLVHEECNAQAGSLPLVDKIKLFFHRKELKPKDE